MYAQAGQMPGFYGQQGQGAGMQANSQLPIQLSFAGDANEQRGYTQAFFGAGGQVGGVVSSTTVRDLLTRFNLPKDYLAKIWTLSSVTPNPANPGLTLPEFLLACYLCRLSVTTRQPPPDAIPDQARAEVTQAVFQLRGGQTQSHVPTGYPPQQQFQQQPQQQQMQQYPQTQVQQMGRPGIVGGPISPQNTGSGYVYPQQPHQQQMIPQMGQQQPQFAGSLGGPQFQQQQQQQVSGFQSGGYNSPPQTQSQTSRWLITPEEKATFDAVFRAWDSRNTGFISGEVAREIFGQSGLAPNVLARIWELSARSDPARLTSAEFAVAMYLVNKKIQGVDLPSSLPPDLVPPGQRALDEAVEAAKRTSLTPQQQTQQRIGAQGQFGGGYGGGSASTLGLSASTLPAASTSILPQGSAVAIAGGGFEERFPDVDSLLADAGVPQSTTRVTTAASLGIAPVQNTFGSGVPPPSQTAASASAPALGNFTPSLVSAPAPRAATSAPLRDTSDREIELLSQLVTLRAKLAQHSATRSHLGAAVAAQADSVASAAAAVKPTGGARIAALTASEDFGGIAKVAGAMKEAAEIESEAKEAGKRIAEWVKKSEAAEREAVEAGQEREGKEAASKAAVARSTNVYGASGTVPPPFGSSSSTVAPPFGTTSATVTPPFVATPSIFPSPLGSSTIGASAAASPSTTTVPPPFGSFSATGLTSIPTPPVPATSPALPPSSSVASIIASTASLPPTPSPASPTSLASNTSQPPASSASDYARRIMEQAQAAIRDTQTRAAENERRAREAVEAVRTGRVGISGGSGAAGTVPPSEVGKFVAPATTIAWSSRAPAPPPPEVANDRPKPRAPPPKPKPAGLGAVANGRPDARLPPPAPSLPAVLPETPSFSSPAHVEPVSVPTQPIAGAPQLMPTSLTATAQVVKSNLRPPSPDSWAEEDEDAQKKKDSVYQPETVPSKDLKSTVSTTGSSPTPDATMIGGDSSKIPARSSLDLDEIAKQARAAREAAKKRETDASEKPQGGISFSTGNPFGLPRSRSPSSVAQRPRSRSPSKTGLDAPAVAVPPNPFGTFGSSNPFGAQSPSFIGASSSNPFGPLATSTTGNPFGTVHSRRPSDLDWLGTPSSDMDKNPKADDNSDIVKASQAGARADFRSEIAAARTGGAVEAKKKLEGLFAPAPVEKDTPPNPIKLDKATGETDVTKKPSVHKEVLDAVKTGKDLGLPSMADRRALLEKKFSDVGPATSPSGSSTPSAVPKPEPARSWEKVEVSPLAPPPPPLAPGEIPPPPPPPPPGTKVSAPSSLISSQENVYTPPKITRSGSPPIAPSSLEQRKDVPFTVPASIPLTLPAPSSTPQGATSSKETDSSWGDVQSSSPIVVSTPEILYHVRTLYQYEHTQPDDLTFDSNCVIAVEKEEGDWRFGKIVEGKDGVGREGWFPLTYVEKIENFVPGSLMTTANPNPPTLTVTSPKYEAKAVVSFDYAATREDEMTIHAGELLGILNKEDPEWWLAERLEDPQHKAVGAVGERGVVPQTYVEIQENGVQDFEERGGGGFGGGKTWVPAGKVNGFEDTFTKTADIDQDVANPFGSSEDTPWQAADLPAAVVSEPPRQMLGKSTSSAVSKIPPLVSVSPAALARTRHSGVDNGDKRNSNGFSFMGDSVSSPSGSPESSRRNSIPAPLRASAQLSVSSSGSVEGLSLSRSGSREISPAKEYETWSSRMDPRIVDSLPAVERKRQEAIYELIKTEQTYVQDLQIIVDDFLNNMEKFMRPEDLKQIFSNIGEILEKNATYMSEILQVQQDDGMIVQVIGPTFLKHSKTLDLYKIYCVGQMDASKFLQKKRQEDKQLGDFLKARQRDPKCRSLDLSTFLLEPMQRLTRYPLLLRKVIHYTSKSHPDHDSLLIALNLAEKALEEVNERAKDIDNRRKLEEISGFVDFEKAEENLNTKLNDVKQRIDLFAPTRLVGKRQFVYEGSLTKAKSNRKLYGYLFNDLLLLVERKSATAISVAKNNFQYWMYRKPLPLSECVGREIPPNTRLPFSVDESCFQIVHIEDIITFRAPSAANKRTWLNHLDRQVTNLSAASKTAEKQKQHRTSVNTFNATGTLKLTILEGTDILQPDITKIEVFCRAEVGHQSIKTKVVRDSALRFNQTLMFSVENLDETVRITVLNSDKYSQDEVLGVAEMQLDFLEYYGENETRISLPLKNAAPRAALAAAMQFVRHV
ncbi:Intersectin 1 (SH3 domain protein) [Gonapodya sp. JEL0774]|nr:Intersectin 1 (SH3 domain protein) [Gonapodya sp. JEL0774]